MALNSIDGYVNGPQCITNMVSLQLVVAFTPPEKHLRTSYKSVKSEGVTTRFRNAPLSVNSTAFKWH